MAKFLAVTSLGLVEVLENEMKELGLKTLGREPSGVWFEGNWGACYKANLCLRTATRIMLPILDFPAYQNEELYDNVLKHDYTKYIGPEHTLSVEATVRDSSFRDSRFVTMKVKDAVVDQFRDKFGSRPNVDTHNPDLKLLVKIVKNQVSISIDTTGTTLSQRGYRKEAGEAPMREHLAAGLIKMSKWDIDSPIVDPMCGSGTLLIEAAMMFKKLAPGGNRTKFAFMRLGNFQPETFAEVMNEAQDQEIEFEDPQPLFFGFDRDKKVIAKARRNAIAAGVDDIVQFNWGPVDNLKPPTEQKGILITNPPYGERLEGDTFYQLQDTYRDLAFSLKGQFSGWRAFILAGNSELTRFLKLKATQKIPVWNGPIECRFIEYKIN